MVALNKECLISPTNGAPLEGLKSRVSAVPSMSKKSVRSVGVRRGVCVPSSSFAATSVIFANMSATSTVCARVRVANEVDDSTDRTVQFSAEL